MEEGNGHIFISSGPFHRLALDFSSIAYRSVPTPPTNRNYEGKEKAGEGRRGRRIKDWPRVIIVRGRGRRAPRVIPVQGQTKIRLLELRV